MAHPHLRSEKNCLNCGATVEEHFCPNCGQENLEPKESVAHLFMHFFEDLTHFDGKLLKTMKPLLFKPGFLSEEYIKGRRASYLNPIRMYLFINAIFFFLIMTFFVKDIALPIEKDKQVKTDSVGVKKPAGHGALNYNFSFDGKHKNAGTIYLLDSSANNLHDYDSLQKKLLPERKDGFVTRYFKRRSYATFGYIREHPDTYGDKINEHLAHSFPQLFFVSLPLFGLFLQLLFIRRKQYNYVSHAIFSIHLYCLAFICLFIIIAIPESSGELGAYLGYAIIIGYFVYLYAAMRRFYKQGWLKTFVKFLILNLATIMLLVTLFLFYLTNSFLNLANA